MMTDQMEADVQELVEAAQARATFISFLNLHFTTLLDAAFVTRLRSEELSSVLEALAHDEANGEEVVAGAQLMLAYLERNRKMDLARLTEELGVDRTRLYRGVAKGYGPPPPNEMVWSKVEGDFSVLQAVARFYREAGLEPSSEIKDRVDYIGVELAFLGELAQKEAQAWALGEMETAVHLLETQRNFVNDHVSQWTPYYIESALEHVKTDFYRGHLLMLRGFIQAEQQRLDLIAETLSS
jgi:TorA maturation chaperone TorD